MALYLDTEFNGFGGELISLAIYRPDRLGNYYYGVLLPDNEVNPWVKEHVIPNLNMVWCKKEYFQSTLRKWLIAYAQHDVIYADWAEDFKHLLDQTYGVDGTKYIPKLTMQLITVPDIHVSKIPHNALEDAKALYLNHMELLKRV